MIEITTNTSSEPVRDLITELDGVVFRLVLTFRERQATWYLDLYDAENTALLLGQALLPGELVLVRRQYSPWPSGILILDSPSGDFTKEVTIEGLGTDYILTYLEAADLAAVAAEIAVEDAIDYTIVTPSGIN
jgi:hypothetical protein